MIAPPSNNIYSVRTGLAESDRILRTLRILHVLYTYMRVYAHTRTHIAAGPTARTIDHDLECEKV